MPPDPDEAASDAHQLRHDLLSSLAIVSGQTQLLQRQLVVGFQYLVPGHNLADLLKRRGLGSKGEQVTAAVCSRR